MFTTRNAISANTGTRNWDVCSVSRCPLKPSILLNRRATLKGSLFNHALDDKTSARDSEICYTIRRQKRLLCANR